MAGAQDIQAGRASVSLGLQDTATRGLERFSKRLKAFGQITSAIGAGITATSAAIGTALAAATNHFSTVGDEIAKMSARTGLSTEAVSELGHAVGLSGTDMKTLESGIKKMQDTIISAARGSKQAADALAALGLTAGDLENLTPDQQLGLIADRLSAIEKPALRTAAAMDVLGKSGTNLIPMLSEGSAGLEAMRSAARTAGKSMDQETATAAEKLNDALGTMWSTLEAVKLQVGAALAGPVTKAADKISELAAVVANFISNNKQLVVTVAAITLGLGAAGIALFGVGGAAVAAVGAIAGLKIAFAGIGAVIAAVFSPVGAAIAGVIVAVGAAAFAVWKLADPFKALKPIVDMVVYSVKGITTAIGSGNWQAAADIAMQSVKVVFLKGVNAVLQMWRTTLKNLQSLTAGSASGITDVLGAIVNKVKTLFGSLAPTIGLALNVAMSFAKDAFNQLPTFAAYATARLMRAFVDFQVWLIKSFAKMAMAIVKSFFDLGKNLLTALQHGWASGDFSVIAKSLGDSLSKAVMAGMAGITAAEAPTFRISDQTKKAGQQLVDGIHSAEMSLFRKMQRVPGAIATQVTSPTLSPTEQSSFDDLKKGPEIDPTALEKFRDRLTELQSSNLSPEKLASGFSQLRKELLGIEDTPLQQLRDRVILLNDAYQRGAISQAEWTAQLQQAKQGILGLDSSPIDKFTERIKELREQIMAGALSRDDVAGQVKKAQQDFLGFDPSPVETYTARIKELQYALSKGFITKEQFDTAALEALPDRAKEIIEKAKSPLDKFKERMKEIQALKDSGQINQHQFELEARDLTKQLIKDSGAGEGITSEGTFSAVAARGMGIGGVSDKGLRAQMEANEILRGIHTEVKKKGGLK